MNTSEHPHSPGRSLGAWAFFAFQLLWIGFSAWFGHSLPFDNRIDRFAVAESESDRNQDFFLKHFPSTQFCILSLELALPNDLAARAKAETFFLELVQIPGVSELFSLRLFSEDLSTPRALPFPFERNGVYSALLAIDDREAEIVPRLLERIERLPQEQDWVRSARLAGEPFVNWELNRSSLEVKQRFFPLLILAALLLLMGLFRDWRVLPVCALAVGAALATTLGWMRLTGHSMNLVTTLTPTLVFVLAVAMQIHVLIAIAQTGSIRAGIRAKLVPNFYVSLTTFLGFGSLITSRVEAVRLMGIDMAVGVWAIFFWAHLTHFGISRLLRLELALPRLSGLDRLFHSRAYRGWLSARGTLRVLRLPAAIALILAGAWALWRNPLESNGLNYFPPAHPLRLQTDFLQQRITGASHLELLIDFENRPLDWVALAQLEEALARLPNLRCQLSLNQFERFARASLSEEEQTSFPPGALLEEGALPELGEKLLRDGVYRNILLVNSLDKQAYRELSAAIRAELRKVGLEHEARLTGPLARIIEIQDYLLGSLSQSLLLTIVLSTGFIWFLLRGHFHLSQVLLPNLFPLGLIALLMPLLGIKTSISTVMIFSIAFGIAVDDTIHLLHSYHHLGGDPATRWQATLARDAKAITLTSLVLTAGFSVLLFSDFLPTRDFGLLLALGMIAAWFADTWLLPALLLK